VDRKIIAGLDIGTEKVCTVIGTKTDEGNIDILGLGTSKSAGLRHGMVIDIEETISAISKSLEEAEKMSGRTLEAAYVGIGGSHIESSNSKGVIAVSRADGEITQEDIDRVVEAARAVSIPPNREIIHVIPRIFTVDGQPGIHDPVGMTGTRLEVETHVISGSTPVIKNLSKCVYQAGLNINEFVFNPIASAEVLIDKKQKEIGVALVDIGAGTTELAVFEEGDILHSAVLPLGSAHITNDIAIGLRISIETAEVIKKELSSATPGEISEDEEIDLAKIDKNEEQTASKKYVAEIIEARLSEIFSHISDELESINREANLPAGIILSGGGAKTPGLVTAAKEALRLPVQIGKLNLDISGMIDKINDPIYTAAIGLMAWGINNQETQGPVRASNLSGTASRIKGWFKNFLP
jgi:cell division protein FtsA